MIENNQKSTNDVKTTSDAWTETSKSIKTKWSRLSDANIETCRENISLLSGELQRVYGFAKEKADKEVSEFKSTLHNAPSTGSGNHQDAKPVEKMTTATPNTADREKLGSVAKPA